MRFPPRRIAYIIQEERIRESWGNSPKFLGLFLFIKKQSLAKDNKKHYP